MNVVVLTYDEKFITFLNPELLTLVETETIDSLRTANVTYTMEHENDAQELFRIGNKLWVTKDGNKGNLYVINTKVKRDYFKENNVTFDAEDVLVELNYAPLFSQTDLTAKNGFTIGSTNGQKNVKVDYKALDYWFGEYFNIGVVQDCLNTRIQRISPTGTMSKMELLRFIETETNNRFITRYEKDNNNNQIHRFLDYLNPNSNDTNFEVNFQFIPTGIETPLPDEIVEPIDPDDTLPQYTPPTPHSLEDIKLTFLDKTGSGITGLTWDATALHVDSDSDVIVINAKYTKPNLQISVTNRTYNTTTNTDLPGDNKPDDTAFNDTTYAFTVQNVTLTNGTVFEVKDSSNGDVLYSHEINPCLGDVHTEILDLGYNVENIEYTVDEEDTYLAVAPRFSLDGGSSSLSETDLEGIITKWKNLEVPKGQSIPMIVQKTTVKGDYTTTSKMDAFLLNNNTTDSSGNITKYYQRPVKPNDNIDDNTASNSTFEFLVGTAYWYAPFTKHSGELYLQVDEETGAEYTHIINRSDYNGDMYGAAYRPKTNVVTTTDEDVYQIYNTMALALKDCKDPTVDIDVDVANYRNGEYNNYNLYDKVYVKVPGFESLITAVVSETSKNLHDIGENTIKLTNFTVNTKVTTKETVIYGDNLNFKYPKTKKLNVTLADISSSGDVNLANKLVTFTLYKIKDNSQVFKKAYHRKTNSNGVATLNIKKKPGDYIVEVNFGGDIEYTSSSATFEVNISGKTPEKEETSTTKKTKKVKRYWTKCGVSPDKKEVVAIAQPSASNSDMKKYGVNYNTIYKTVFKNKCPYCGQAKLRYDDGRKNGCITAHGHSGNKREVPEGEITCHHCDSDFDGVTGLEKSNRHTGRLTMLEKPAKSNKTEKARLISGKLLYDVQEVEIKEKKNNKKTGSYTTLRTINKKVKEKGQKLAKNKTDYEALLAIASFMGTVKYGKYAGFKKSTSGVLSSNRGNCCDQANLFLELCDAAGLTGTYDFYYVHVCCNHTSWPGVGHIFTKVVKKSNNKSVYVDPTQSNPYNHYTHGWGSPPGTTTKYPNKPF